MISFLKLIRWQNLLIIIITQFLIRYALIGTLAGNIMLEGVLAEGPESFMSLQLPVLDFIILVFSTVLITAGGYVINDYFDIRTDLVNKGEVIVGTKVPRRRAIMWHNILSLLGVIAGFWLSFRTGCWWLGMIFLLVTGLLYFYSVTYKKQFLIGNIIVAILTGFVPLMVVLFELMAIYNYYGADLLSTSALKIIFYWVAAYAVFAFLTTLGREIVKDMEDFEGDKAYGSRSLPVVTGINTSKAVVTVIIVITVVLVGTMWSLFINEIISIIYILIAIVLPLLISLLVLFRSKTARQFRNVSRILKAVMLTGVLYTVLYWILSNKGLLI